VVMLRFESAPTMVGELLVEDKDACLYDADMMYISESAPLEPGWLPDMTTAKKVVVSHSSIAARDGDLPTP
jgi:hypothetical protein